MAKASLATRVPGAILSSPLHPRLSRHRLVLGFTGRRSGLRHATAVNYLQRGRELLITTNHRWWRNVEGGAPVRLRLRGRWVRATGEAFGDPEPGADALTALIRAHPPHRRWAHVRIDADGAPDAADEAAEAAEVARGRVLVRVELGDEDTADR